MLRAITTSAGRSLEEQDRRRMELHYGADFSTVRVHADAEAAAWTDALDAQAFTAGEHIAFGVGTYAPHTARGSWILAHELEHVMQQRHATINGPAADGVRVSDPSDPDELAAATQADRAATSVPTAAAQMVNRRPSAHPLRPAATIQRLIRSPYPWRGVITPAIGAHIRSVPDASDPANIVDSIPQGATVDVLSASGDWLRVRSRYYGGALVEGYILHTLVDDAAAHKMEASVGTTMVWRGSGPGSGTNFETWASAPTETPFPAVTATTVMNCWEAVLLAAYRAGDITWGWIHHLYTGVPYDAAHWVAAMSKGPLHEYAVGGPNPVKPQRGDLVFFNGTAHVALATGVGSKLYTFWPPPDTPFVFGGTPDKVKIFTIEDLVAYWIAHAPPPPPKVEFAAPAW